MFEPYEAEQEGMIKDALEASGHPELPTIIAVAKGVKPLTELWVTNFAYERLKEFCKKYHLVLDHDNFMAAVPTDKFLNRFEQGMKLGTTKLIGLPYRPQVEGTWLKAYLADSQKTIDQAKRFSWYSLIINNQIIMDRPLDNFRFGDYLGFPRCCTEFYSMHNIRLPDDQESGFNTPIEVFKNTTGKFSLYCNSIPMGHWYFLIRHHPCSFNCQATIKLAKQVHRAIREEDQEYADKIIQHLKYPALVYGEKNAFVFEGEMKNKKINYGEVYFCGAERDRSRADVFRKGNQVKVTDELVSIYKDGDFVTGIKKNHKYDGVAMQFE